MAKAFKPQVRFMTNESAKDYFNHKTNSLYITKTFNTYSEVKKEIRNILINHVGEDLVSVSRHRRGEWGEWFEKWALIHGRPQIVEKGWQ